MSPPGPVAGLFRACHPGPTIAVTAISAGLAALARVPPGNGLLLVAAVGAGQLSIGWSNDWIDAHRDRAVRRAGKPLVDGDVRRETVAVAAFLALGLTSVLTLALGGLVGWGCAAAAFAVVVCGWAYNAGLKGTPCSFLPYAVAFGSLPIAATMARAAPTWPAWWAIVTGAVLGVAAHLANVLPDLADDRETGVRGLPHRLGGRWTAVGAAVLLLGASVLALFGPPGPAPRWAWWAAAVLAALTLGWLSAQVGGGAVSRRWGFRVLIAVVLVDLALFALAGTQLA